MGTVWTGGDVGPRYERDRRAAQKKVDTDNAGGAAAWRSAASVLATQPSAPATPEPKSEPRTPEGKENRSAARKGTRRRTASSLAQSDGLRGLRERVSIHGRTGGILGMDHSH